MRIWMMWFWRKNSLNVRLIPSHLLPTWRPPPLLLNNAEFGSCKALSAVDNGGSGCSKRARNCNFSCNHFIHLIVRWKSCTKMPYFDCTRTFCFFHSVALERGSAAAPRLRQFWVHLQITPLTTPREETKRRFSKPHKARTCFFYLHMFI